MEQALMKRDAQGKFALKNEEHRSVRSLRLTDTTWSALGVKAELLCLTRADLLEQMFKSNDHPYPSNTRMLKEIAPGNISVKAGEEPSNTRYLQEIERLKVEVTHLREEKVKLLERVAAVQLPQVEELEAGRDRVLSSLKLGKQASGYKKAKSVLNQFIELLLY